MCGTCCSQIDIYLETHMGCALMSLVLPKPRQEKVEKRLSPSDFAWPQSWPWIPEQVACDLVV